MTNDTDGTLNPLQNMLQKLSLLPPRNPTDYPTFHNPRHRADYPPSPHHPATKYRQHEHDLTVHTLRTLYSSLLQDMAPTHHQVANPTIHRNSGWWKNGGTITVVGSEDVGYDYSYTPKMSKQRQVEMGDWERDGIRRYYTGGAVVGGGGGGENLGVSVAVDGVEMGPTRESALRKVGDGSGLGSILGKDEEQEDDSMFDVDITSSLEDIALEMETINANDGTSNAPDKNKDSDDSLRPDDKTNITTFESLYHISPTMVWRLRSAYSPTTPQEEHLLFTGSDALAHRHPHSADGMVKGLEAARQCEQRCCDGLWRVGELVCLCERMKNRYYAERDGKDSLDEGDDDIEAAEAVFAYFCEKNILPMLVDAILSRPPPMTAMVPDQTASPFSGATWTATVKSQIFQVIAMILFNTTSPLSLTYLLSNNYMNELVMGMLPLEQWREDALEEILPPYVTLLRGLVMKLRGEEGKCCIPLLLCQRPKRRVDPKQDKEDDTDTEAYMPLFFAAVHVLVSRLGSSLRDSEGCLVKTTAMNVILNLSRITDPAVRDILVNGPDTGADGMHLPTTKSQLIATPRSAAAHSTHLTIEQDLLFPSICESLKVCYQRSVRLLMASLSLSSKKLSSTKARRLQISQIELVHAKEEAASRHKELASGLLYELRYWFGFLDDLLSCEIRKWNVRLCEYIMGEVIVGEVLLKWNRSLEDLKRGASGSMKMSEELKALAEIRTSVFFLTQFFGMVEYPPLVRMVAAALMNDTYPLQWCEPDGDKIGSEDGFFSVTHNLNNMVTAKGNRQGEEADAGAGGKSPTTDTNPGGTRSAQDEVQSSFEEVTHGHLDRQPSLRHSPSSEMDHRALETAAAVLNLNELAKTVELNCNETRRFNSPNPNRHRISLLNMLAGDSHPVEDTTLAAMLVATILENGAIDDNFLEILDVLPSSTSSPFEGAIAKYLEERLNPLPLDLDPRSYESLATAIEYVSSLGLMLLQRIIYHNWTEDGECLDEVPFQHYYSSSRFIRSLKLSLKSFGEHSLDVSKKESHVDLFADYMESEIKKRYSQTVLESPRQEKTSTYTCYLTSFYPSNFIDNGYIGAIPSSELILGIQDWQFTIRVTLHLRSLATCVQEFYERFPTLTGPRSISNRRFCDIDNILSFRTIEEADDAILTIGSLQTSPSLRRGKEIDIRGRKIFHGFEYKQRLNVIDAAVVSLILVIDPEEIIVGTRVQGDRNRCSVRTSFPIGNVIACATEKTLLHVALRRSDDDDKLTDDIVKGGMTIDFKTNDASFSVKECLDKYCNAYRRRKSFEIEDMLVKCCSLMGNEDTERISIGEEGWGDFQG